MIVSHDGLDVLRRQVSGFRDDPDASLRSLVTGDDAADVVIIELDGLVTGSISSGGAGGWPGDEQGEGSCGYPPRIRMLWSPSVLSFTCTRRPTSQASHTDKSPILTPNDHTRQGRVSSRRFELTAGYDRT